MSDDTPHIPADLQDRLREEPADVHADLEAVWALLGTAEDAASKEADPDAAWTALVRRRPELDATPSDGADDPAADRTHVAPASRRRDRSARQPRRQQWRVPTTVGMALAALLLLAGLWLWQRPVTVTAPAGQQRTATLPDGSTVELNSGTTLAYRRGFQAWPFVDADRRTVRLDGEAFFEVAEGSRPFTVETANAQVVVTGTRFNVQARPETESTPKTEVTVVDGSVRVFSQKQPDRSVVLSKPGHVSRVTGRRAAPTSPEPTSVKHVLAWRDNGFAARAQPLTAVLRALERRYDAVLQVHASVERPKRRISLYYPTPRDLETILHDLCTARDLNYRPTSRGFEIFAASDAR
jgi:ferric-dicitrate binding protein FerR (iron transport regulator)